jgi:Uma2 family endonuclease
MLTIADEPLTKQALIERWKEVLDMLNGSNICAGKIELDPYGNVIMSPFTGKRHQTRAEWITQFLILYLPTWTVLQNIGVLISNGVQQPDVLATTQQLSEAEDDENLPFDPAPEICVEVISPSNRRGEMEQKLKKYFEAGAQEVWVCSRKNRMSFFNAQGEIERSQLVPEFPVLIKLAILPILKLQQEHLKLQQGYVKLQQEHTELQQKHAKLQQEGKEGQI